MIPPDETFNSAPAPDVANPFIGYALPEWVTNSGPPFAECGLLPEHFPPCVFPPVVEPEGSVDNTDLSGVDSGFAQPAPPTDSPDFGLCTTMAVGEEAGDMLIGSCWPTCFLPPPIDVPSPTTLEPGENGEVDGKPDPEGLIDPSENVFIPWRQEWAVDPELVPTDSAIPSESLIDDPFTSDSRPAVETGENWENAGADNYFNTNVSYNVTEEQDFSGDHSLNQTEDYQIYTTYLFTLDIPYYWCGVDSSLYYSVSDDWSESPDYIELADNEMNPANSDQLLDYENLYGNPESEWIPDEHNGEYQVYETNSIDLENDSIPPHIYRGLGSSDQIKPWYRSVILPICHLQPLVEVESGSDLMMSFTKTLNEDLNSELKTNNSSDLISLTSQVPASIGESSSIDGGNPGSIARETGVFQISTLVNPTQQPAASSNSRLPSPAPADELAEENASNPGILPSAAVAGSPPLDPAVLLLLEDSGVTPQALDQFDLPLVARKD
ncbi:MAG: hypothetical protein ACK6BG_02725 [Cyanobacteriota bacterium]